MASQYRDDICTQPQPQPPAQPAQSWASWILDSYASSVHPMDEVPYEDSTDRPRNTASSASPQAEKPPQRFGRGGYGNFKRPGPSKPGDPEAQNMREHERQSSINNRQKAAAFAGRLETSSTIQQKGQAVRRKKKPEYLTIVGRGGVGNYQNPELLSPRSPSFPTPAPPVRRSSNVAIPSSSSTVTNHGRGGAGNYATAQASAEAEKHKEIELQSWTATKTR